MCCVDIAFTVRLGDPTQESLELGERSELAGIDESRWRYVLGDVWRTAVNGNAAGEETVEQFFRDVARKTGVLEHDGETIAGEQRELVSHGTAVHPLGSCMQLRFNGRMAPVPALAIQVEILYIAQSLDRPEPGSIAVTRDRPIAQSRQRAFEGHFARSVQPTRDVAPTRQGFVAVDHGQESALRPRAPGGSGVRARLR